MLVKLFIIFTLLFSSLQFTIATADQTYDINGKHVTYYPEALMISHNPSAVVRGTQRIVSVNYLFGRPLIPYNFLKGIFTSNFRDMGNLRPSVFGLIKMLFWVPKKGQLRFSERKKT